VPGDIGNRLLEGVQLLSKRRDLLGKLFRLGLLSYELILNDLQLVDAPICSPACPKILAIDRMACLRVT